MLQVENKANEQFIHIWQDAFSDTKEEILDLLKACEGRERILLWEEDGKTAGQCVLIPAMYLGEQIWYLYAVATAVHFRRQGVCTKLLCAVEELLAKEDSSAVLVPADDALAKFYEKRGFSPLFIGEKTVVTAGQNAVSKERDKDVISCVDIADIDIKTYLDLRKKEFSLSPAIELPKSLLTYAIRQHIACGGKLKKLIWNGREYGILYEKKGSELFFKEITAADGQEAKRATAAFLLNMGEKTAYLQRSYPTYAMGMDQAKLQRGRKQGYFNLVMD